MISQIANNKASGLTGKDCDAGIPIVGRTSGNVYEIVKVENDGTLSSDAGGIVIPQTTGFTYQPEVSILPSGIIPAGACIIYNPLPSSGFFIDITEAGIYNIRPFLFFRATVAGTITFVLIKTGTAADTYTSLRALGTDTWTPTISEVQGVVAYYTLIPTVRASGGTVYKTQFNPTLIPENCYYLGIGQYKLLVICATTSTTNDNNLLYGFETFYKIG
jgi:hypothetical protein